MAQVNTSDIRTRIKNMIDADSAVSAFTPSVTVFDVAPMAVQRANLPCIIITDGNGTYDNTSMGARYLKVSLNFSLLLLMQEWTNNAEINIKSTLIDQMTTAIENVFVTYSPLIYNGDNLKGVRQAQLVTVGGIVPRLYPQIQGATPYVSKQWNLQVIYTRKI